MRETPRPEPLDGLGLDRLEVDEVRRQIVVVAAKMSFPIKDTTSEAVHALRIIIARLQVVFRLSYGFTAEFFGDLTPPDLSDTLPYPRRRASGLLKAVD